MDNLVELGAGTLAGELLGTLLGLNRLVALMLLQVWRIDEEELTGLVQKQSAQGPPYLKHRKQSTLPAVVINKLWMLGKEGVSGDAAGLGGWLLNMVYLTIRGFRSQQRLLRRQ